MKFSLCMIVKNEASILGDCLDSLKDIMDEIIIVDTGSTDDTKKLQRVIRHMFTNINGMMILQRREILHFRRRQATIFILQMPMR